MNEVSKPQALACRFPTLQTAYQPRKARISLFQGIRGESFVVSATFANAGLWQFVPFVRVDAGACGEMPWRTLICLAEPAIAIPWQKFCIHGRVRRQLRVAEVAKIQILVGSVNGMALQSAMAVAHVLNRQGHEVRVNEEPRYADLLQDGEEVLLVCCSTTGDGELPRNIYPLFLALDDGAIELHGRYYGVIALGDSG
ncbi:flavodoxin domain-containing protein [Acidihalobacter aeolianus]|uniref:flavodoxin domain-containing protein n=1 Tax=Acidihalobacter aeolianus TaxID=2792603 RepID=UPI0018D274E3|nr:flavodoxin domain-containing protein [Acidihalobacter aeolianus]